MLRSGSASTFEDHPVETGFPVESYRTVLLSDYDSDSSCAGEVILALEASKATMVVVRDVVFSDI